MATDVPCNGCTACCRGTDDWEWYLLFDDLDEVTRAFANGLAPVFRVPPFEREGRWEMPRGDNRCLYLGESGCEAYDVRPRMCKEFDCREQPIVLLPKHVFEAVLALPEEET